MRQFIRKNIWAVAPVVLVLMALALLGSPLSSKVQETPAEDDNLIVVGVAQVGSESVWRSAHTQSIQDAFTRANGYCKVINEECSDMDIYLTVFVRASRELQRVCTHFERGVITGSM